MKGDLVRKPTHNPSLEVETFWRNLPLILVAVVLVLTSVFVEWGEIDADYSL